MAYGDAHAREFSDVRSPPSTVLSLTLGHNDTLGLPLRWLEGGAYVGPMMQIVKELSRRSGIRFDRFYKS